MGLLSASLKVELQKQNPSVHPLLEIDFPSGTKRYSKPGVSSSSLGPYEPRVKSFGRLKRSVADRQNALQAVNVDVSINDADLTFARILGRGERILDAAARIKFVSPNVAVADWFTAFTGRLYEWHNTAPLEWSLSFRPNDITLNTSFPRTVVSKYDWPDADDGALGKIAPLIYGLHDSSGETDTGAVPVLYVDTVGFRYLVCLGYALDVMRVYVDGVRQTSGYQITRPVIGGRQWTLIDFANDKGTSTITCEVKGYESTGDGTGSLITDPSDQIKHMLVNFVYNEYQSGNWFSDSTAPVDTTAFATTKTFFSTRAGGGAYVGGRYVNQVTTGMQELNAWCSQYEIKSWWTPDGEIAIEPDDPNSATVYVSDPWIRYPADDLGVTLRTEYTIQDAIKTMKASHSYQAADSQYLFSLEAEDPLATITATESIEMSWGPHFE